VRFNLLRILQCGVAGKILALSMQTSLLAQEKAPTTQPTEVSVPFIGCMSDGQAGPMEAPKGRTRSVPISSSAAQKMAYYSAFEQGVGVLAPRGWYCFGIYGSSGSVLFVGPQPTDTANLHSAGPAILISHTSGEGSGAVEVAKIMARVFPAYRISPPL